MMELETGAILEGKVTGITKFGAFVALPDGKSGLVHISELSNGYVSKVEDYVQLGQTVKVKLLSIGDAGKINLSIKRVEERPTQSDFRKRPDKVRAEGPKQVSAPGSAPSAKDEFEDRLKKFMQESDSRIADNRMYADRKQRSRKR